jgi:hypothetical protein
MPHEETEISVRVIVDGPPRGVAFLMQRGRNELVPPVKSTAQQLVFEFALRVGHRPTGEPNFLGPFTQGPPQARFVYINSGTYAGQSNTPWSRRAKIHLRAIPWKLITRAQATGAVIETKIDGTGRDGGPVCASVHLEPSDWTLAT